jgi:hypothetical protein
MVNTYRTKEGIVRRLILVLFSAGLLAFSACSGNSGKETFETAQLEELQKNFTHAAQLYREIIQKHPKSDYAAKAAERLKELERK